MSTKPCQIKVKTFVEFSLVQKKDLFDSQCAMLWCPVYHVTTAKRPERKKEILPVTCEQRFLDNYVSIHLSWIT